MAYEMRSRNKRVIYGERAAFPGSEEDSDHNSDPDYSADQMQQNGAASSSSRNVGRCRHQRRRTNLMRPHAQVPPETSNKTILSWLTDKGILEENEVIECNGKVGYIHKGSVPCDCCGPVFNVYEFASHSNPDRHPKNPYESIFERNSTDSKEYSLLYLMICAWNSKDEEDSCCFFHVQHLRNGACDTSYDDCMLCANNYNNLPGSKDMELQNFPMEKWLCKYCVCKYCGLTAGHLDSCKECEKKFHSNCLLNRNVVFLQEQYSYCSLTCAKIFKQLKNLVGVKNKLEDGFSWTLLQQNSLKSVSKVDTDKHKRVECNCKIGVAWNTIKECFPSYVDRHTGVDILQRVLYNCCSNLRSTNLKRFYAVVLERDDNIISIATIRVHGAEIAEMPFVATRLEYKHQGMLRKLFNAIESTLSNLKVETLVIPVLPEGDDMWIKQFGFPPVGDDIKNKLMIHKILMLPGAVRLYKSTVARPFEAEQAEPSNAAHVENNGVDHQPSPVIPEVDRADNNPSPLPVNSNAVDKNSSPTNGVDGRVNMANRDSNTPKILPFDLNFEPPEEDDDFI